MSGQIALGEAFIVGPEDKVLIRVPLELDEAGIESLLDHLVDIGLKDRALVMAGEFEIAVVKGEVNE